MDREKLGILGGTFDPVHAGHVILALDAREALGLDRLLFVPAAIPPHKIGREHAPAGDRLEMVRLAVQGIPGLGVSEVEFAREGPSYSVDTVEALAGEYPECELYFLVGEDNIEEIWTWKEPERLFRLCRVVVLGRGAPSPASPGRDLPGPVTTLARRRIDLSSSEVRDRVRRGLPIRCLVPLPVERYIKDHSLYRRDPVGRARTGPSSGGGR